MEKEQRSMIIYSCTRYEMMVQGRCQEKQLDIYMLSPSYFFNPTLQQPLRRDNVNFRKKFNLGIRREFDHGGLEKKHSSGEVLLKRTP